MLSTHDCHRHYTDTLGVLARTIGTENFAPISNESVALGLVGDVSEWVWQ